MGTKVAMRIVFFDKKAETYKAIENVTHMHIDYIKNRKCYVFYTEEGIKYLPYSGYDLHKIDC